MKIKTQFTLATLVFCLIFILIGSSLLYTYSEVSRLGQQQDIALDVVRGAYELSYISNDYLFHPEEQRQNIQWDSRYAVLSNDVSRLSVDIPEQKMLVDRIIASKNRLHDVYVQSVVAVEASKTSQGRPVDPELIEVAWSRVVIQNEAMIFDASHLSQLLQEESYRLQNVNTILVFLLMVFLLLFLLTNYVFFKRRIFQSLSALNDGTKIIGAGNLAFQVDAPYDDEIGELSVAFNQMTANLSKVTASKIDLEHEITGRKRAEDALQNAYSNLEILVQKRTEQLADANKELQQEISERIRAEEALRESEVTFKALAGNANEGILVAVTPEHHTYANRRACEILGYTVAELLNCSITDLSAPGTAGALLDSFRTRLLGEDIPKRYETSLRHKDGTIIPVEISAARTSWHGQPADLVIIHDITERKQAEESIRDLLLEVQLEKDRLASLINSISDEIWFADTTKTFTLANPQAMMEFGLDPGETEVEKLVRDLEVYRPDGSLMRAIVFTSLIYQGDTVTGFRGIVFDITERLKLEDEIKKLNQDLEARVRDRTEELADTVKKLQDENAERKRVEERMLLTNAKLSLMNDVTYQDIQNKVTALRGFLVLMRKAKTDDVRGALYDRENSVLENIQNLIKNTKDYQKMDIDTLEWLDVEKIIQEITLPPDLAITIKSDIPGLFIHSNPLISRVFQILVDNAVTHGKKTTCISFYYRKTPDGITIVCEDDGEGIPHGEKAGIFDRVAAGEGKFSLFFVHEFFTLSGAGITETGEPGKGARFEISVPEGMWWIRGDGD